MDRTAYLVTARRALRSFQLEADRALWAVPQLVVLLHSEVAGRMTWVHHPPTGRTFFVNAERGGASELREARELTRGQRLAVGLPARRCDVPR